LLQIAAASLLQEPASSLLQEAVVSLLRGAIVPSTAVSCICDAEKHILFSGWELLDQVNEEIFRVVVLAKAVFIQSGSVLFYPHLL